MKGRHAFSLRWTKRVLAWTALIAITLLLGLLLQAFAANALVQIGPTTLPTVCRAALSTGHDVRESFLAHICSGPVGATSQP
jgi:hypothetical protein